MNASDFYEALAAHGFDMFCGVPDSCLKEFCACVTDRVPFERNIIAANEGNALGIAVGHYLATSRPAVVYMQNSGLGNIVNPLLSIADEEVYKIPALFIIGWRGEPGVHDEPQHVKQGKLTLPLLDLMDVRYEILESVSQIDAACEYMRATGKPFALVVKKGAFEPYAKAKTKDYGTLSREEAIKIVLSLMEPDDIVVSTTGMISREVYENRKSHEKDFLTVGGMGHASSIALGIAINKPNRTVFCLDGDGAVLMHMGSLAVNASREPSNFKHVVFNNCAHDSVGGQPTVMDNVNLVGVACPCNYHYASLVENEKEIREAWDDFVSCEGPALLEILVKKGARKDLGRPKEKPVENKEAFMKFVQGKGK